MNYILIPCTSSAPDRAHDAVVLEVDKSLLETLNARRRAFEGVADPTLFAYEYLGGPVHYFRFDNEDGSVSDLDSPSELVALSEHLKDWELSGGWHLEDAPNVYLKVIAEGFFYTWDGRREKHGPSEIYETEVFDLAHLRALYCPTMSL